MKKVIYGILILIGIVAISSNFIVDTTKLDHKKVSASGTACRWISESGIGFGPLYFDDTTSSSVTPEYRLKSQTCNTSISGQTRDANYIYSNATTDEKYSGTIYGSNSEYMVVTSGKITKSSAYKGSSVSNSITNYTTNFYTQSYPLYFTEANYNGPGSIELIFEIDYKISIDSFTCVCAEY